MATTTSSLNRSQIESTISRLQTKLARQQGACKDTEAHIEAMRVLLAQVEKASK